MEPVTFGLHTAEVKKWITQKEANAVKAFFNVRPNEPLSEQTQFYPNGITKIWIEEIGGQKPRFYIHMIVNFSRLLGISNYAIMPFSTANIRKATTAVNKVLKLLPLSPENAMFTDWTVERLDSAFDIQEENTELFMSLLNRSVDLHDGRKKCSRVEIRDEESHSMRFACNAFAYNIYVKLIEVIGKGKSLSEQELNEVRHLLRVERQNHPDAVKKLLPSRSVKDLADAKVRDNILRTMIDEIKLFFGTGDFFSWRGIQENYSAHSAEISTIKEAMMKITANSLEAEYDAYKQVSDTFERLKIAPVGIPRGLGITSIKGLYNRLTEAYTRPADKRQYNSFPVPHKGVDGRYRATVTLYWTNETQRLSIAGRTLEDYEMKVSYKLREVCLINRFSMKVNPEAYEKSLDSLRRFQKVAKSNEVKQEISIFLKPFILQLEKDKNSLTKQEETL